MTSASHIDGDGFGQTLLQDIRYVWRFLGCRRMAVSWRPPREDERRDIDGHAIIERFGDSTDAVANVKGRIWIARERDWYGWPDPPRWAFFALDREGAIWSAADFNFWPSTWRRPEDAQLVEGSKVNA